MLLLRDASVPRGQLRETVGARVAVREFRTCDLEEPTIGEDREDRGTGAQFGVPKRTRDARRQRFYVAEPIGRSVDRVCLLVAPLWREPLLSALCFRHARGSLSLRAAIPEYLPLTRRERERGHSFSFFLARH